MVAVHPSIMPAAERRLAPRRQPALGTVCRLAAAGGVDHGTGLVWNISTHGVSMLLHQRPEPGAALTAELRNANGTATLAVGLRVAHVSLLGTGDYMMGCQFARPLTSEEMRPFLGG